MMKKWIVALAFGSMLIPALSSAQRSRSGADAEEGWVIRRTKKGIIKVPKKQKFRFEGAEIYGDGERPAQSAIGARVPRKNTSLIPVRASFREEGLNVSGLPDR